MEKIKKLSDFLNTPTLERFRGGQNPNYLIDLNFKKYRNDVLDLSKFEVGEIAEINSNRFPYLNGTKVKVLSYENNYIKAVDLGIGFYYLLYPFELKKINLK